MTLLLRSFTSLLFAGVLLSGCDNSLRGDYQADNQADSQTVKAQLEGSWLREYGTGGVNARRLLVLDADGKFRERVRITDAAGAVTEQIHEGTWLYDGTNLKRKYTRMNGKPPSRLNLPFATFQLRFESKNEFVGMDHVHHHEVRYRRVQPDTPF